jgi:hypothetical protein
VTSLSYVIKALPGRPATVQLLGNTGELREPDPAAALPQEVERLMGWLAAFAAGSPLPPGRAPPVLITPANPGEPFIAMTSCEEQPGERR